MSLGTGHRGTRYAPKQCHVPLALGFGMDTHVFISKDRARARHGTALTALGTLGNTWGTIGEQLNNGVNCLGTRCRVQVQRAIFGCQGKLKETSTARER